MGRDMDGRLLGQLSAKIWTELFSGAGLKLAHLRVDLAAEASLRLVDLVCRTFSVIGA